MKEFGESFQVSVLLSVLLLLGSCQKESKVKVNLPKTRFQKAPEAVPTPAVTETRPSERVITPKVLAYGQKNLGHGFVNNSHPKKDTFYIPTDIIKIGSRFVVSDSGNHRILIFNDPSLNSPSVVIGQKDFISGASNAGLNRPSNKTLSNPAGLGTDGTRLFVADSLNNRVLIWNSLPSTNFAPADLVIGQNSFEDTSDNIGLSSVNAKGMKRPFDVAFVSGRLYISDLFNSRILIYNSIPTTSGVAANGVLGQASLTVGRGNRGGKVNNNTLNFPVSIFSNGTQIAVSDYLNSRVLIWNQAPANDVPADIVLGQANFISNLKMSSQAGLKNPMGGLWHNDSLYIADTGNNRGLVWKNMASISSGDQADYVIGQDNFTGSSANKGGGPDEATLKAPRSFLVQGQKLNVIDTVNNRILKYDLSALGSANFKAESVVGQLNFNSGKGNRESINEIGVSGPYSIAVSEKYLIVGERGNSRYSVFDKFETQHGAKAIAVVGQNNFQTRNKNSPTQSLMAIDYAGVAVDRDQRLYVSDSVNNRVLVYNKIPTSNGAKANFVIGQPNFTSNGRAWTKQGLYRPSMLSVYENKLFIADTANTRILVFDLPIVKNHPEATLVIGQDDFVSRGAGLSQSKFNQPGGILYDGKHLSVCDHANNRIMVWAGLPKKNGEKADYVLGQPDFNTSNNTMTRNGFYAGSRNYGIICSTMAVYKGFFLVTDQYAHRVLAFDTSQLANGMNATYVWGAVNDWTSSKPSPLGDSVNKSFHAFGGPANIVRDPYHNLIWTSERYSSRILRIDRDHFWSKKLTP